MVGRSGEPPAGGGEPHERAGEVGAARNEDRQVEEARAHGRAGRGAGGGCELDERRAVVGAEPCEAILAGERAQSDHALVEGPEGVDVRYAQAHGADPRRGGDAHRNSPA